jgi:hypothetical protein
MFIAPVWFFIGWFFLYGWTLAWLGYDLNLGDGRVPPSTKLLVCAFLYIVYLVIGAIAGWLYEHRGPRRRRQRALLHYTGAHK